MAVRSGYLFTCTVHKQQVTSVIFLLEILKPESHLETKRQVKQVNVWQVKPSVSASSVHVAGMLSHWLLRIVPLLGLIDARTSRPWVRERYEIPILARSILLS